MKKLILALALAASLSACNTIQGFGRDVEHVGDKIENTARRSQ